ncbi:nucleotidyltransferase domain-containing protein [Paenibacillus glycinis]|uniref:Nucleotidyltransferase domain-containing protein n=1 Tax=Paenibacillus glycinis TaxID=2697035 RepID=A0ABW9XPE3_9BACL|nr:nucleotidyltransferase domain-containing protein [Paenibacillus glycinis]NBD24252.1 nucleotidyltransferase domain-containing protein [Paenibacillus glycinis]
MSVTREVITEQLNRLEREEEIRILYACESGSRAWGFPSQDSDYDVRFVYIRPADWYLSIHDRRDVIERPISDKLDICGWDLRKTLNLYRKSNPPLLEWLQSPIRYAESGGTAQELRAISPLAFSPKSCMYHYLSMARGNFRMYLQGERVRIKKYFYVLRPVLACEWIQRHGVMPPMEFDVLAEALIPRDTELWRVIQELLARKKAGDELDYEPQLKTINAFLEERLSALEAASAAQPAAGGKLDDRLDAMFREALREAWL